MDAAEAVVGWLKNNTHHFPITAIGHRLVQGGPDHREPEMISDHLLLALHEYVYLAPNHLPEEINTIKTFRSAFPKIYQVACFDTFFHRDMPFYSKYYPLPAEYKDKGLMHYGFHGLSYEYVMHKLAGDDAAISKQKIIIAHLGNGAGMAAVQNGISVETTMGLSPIGGLVMGTRSGDLDPGVLLFLLKQGRLTPTQLDDLLSKHSGLTAICGISDMQELLKNETNNPKAKEALTVFCYHAKKFIGALAASMSGLDMVVFTGGIGENSASIRERICQDLEFLGITISEKQNHDMHEIISTEKSKVSVRVLKTNEEWMIARHTQDTIDKEN